MATTLTPAGRPGAEGPGRPRRRIEPPRVPSGELVLNPPPRLPQSGPGGPLGWLQYLLPAVGSLGFLVFALANRNPLYMLGAGLFAVTAIAVGAGIAIQQRSGTRFRLARDRIRYLEYLDGIKDRLGSAALAQDEAGRWAHPPPAALIDVVVRSPRRVFERRSSDDDFLRLRCGTGSVLPALQPRLDADLDDPTQELDPVSLAAGRRVLDAWARLPAQPVPLDLRATPVMCLTGDSARSLARAVLLQGAVFHGPADLRVVVAVDDVSAPRWTWVKWLPHVLHPQARDAGSRARLFASDPGELAGLIEAELDARRGAARAGDEGAQFAGGHLVVVVDRPPTPGSTGDAGFDAALSEAAGLGVTIVWVGHAHASADLVVAADASGGLVLTPETEAIGEEADGISVAEAEWLARALAAAAPERAEARPLADSLPLPEILGFDPVTFDPAVMWRPTSTAEALRVPIGVGPGGDKVVLDLKESALGGMGPHGLIVGATGSGKSELLRTLVVALAARHPPDQLNFVLVDFKGGATFAALGELPHLAGLITNLADDLALVDRMHDALYGEMQRRQELLRAAGNFDTQRDYQLAKEAGAALEPLPTLLVIVDEFSELLAGKPDFIDMFVALGRVGRSLGMHLLLASQRLEEGRLRGLDSHLSYRIGLRTFSAADSRAVLDVSDAYELPPVPGSGLLKAESTSLQRFRAAYVSGPVRAAAEEDEEAPPGVLPFTASNLDPPSRPAATFTGDGGGPTVLQAVVERLAGHGERAHQVWLPPLEQPAALDDLLGGVIRDPQRGLQAVRWRPGGLTIPVGVADKPREQRRDPLVAELGGALGNVGVVGGPRSGKSMLIATLVISLALTHTPAEVQVYVLDLSGGLAPLRALPHVGTVATRLEPELVRRLVAEVGLFLHEREERFRRAGVDSAATMRRMRAEGTLADEPLGDIFLVVDGWATVRREFEDLEQTVIDVPTRGLGFGVHVVVGTNRWLDLRPQLKDALGTRLELRLGDPVESELDRKAARNVPAGRPGRGISEGGLHFLGALPRIDGGTGADDLAEAMTAAGTRAAQAWPARPAPPVRVLPPRVSLDDLPAPGADAEQGVPLGLGELELAPVYVDLQGPDPHFFVFGDGASGKTTLLRTFIAGLTRRRGPEEARVIVVDYRRSLVGAVPESHLLAYAGSAPALEAVVADLAGSMRRRLPGPEVTPDRMSSRTWWSGPEAYVVVDDYDLVVTPSGNPLAPLADLLAQARDIGLHVVLARRVGGLQRALYEPFLQRLKDLSTPGLILSGSRDEGPVIGPYRASEQPPGRGLLVGRTLRVQLVQVARPE